MASTLNLALKDEGKMASIASLISGTLTLSMRRNSCRWPTHVMNALPHKNWSNCKLRSESYKLNIENLISGSPSSPSSEELDDQIDGHHGFEQPDIFLCHSGAQKDFSHQLWVDLDAQHRHVFLDIVSLPMAESFPQLILNAARGCRLAVLVLSEEFFTRSIWPMLELQAFLDVIESRKNHHLKLLPLFFKTSSEDLKDPENQGRWLSKWKEWASKNSRIDVDKCSKALKVLKTTKGLVFRQGMGEVEYRRIIVKAICQMVPPYFATDLSYVQGSQRICQEMIRKLKQLPWKETRLASRTPILGVYGSVGMGKTTLSKILCNYFRKQMVGCRVCHVEIEPGQDLLDLQKFAIRQLTGAPQRLLKTLRDLDEGQYLLSKLISKHQVFLAIDNIYTCELSIRMTRMFLSLGLRKDSLLLVTANTREELLEVIGYDAAQNCFHVPNLTEIEAIQILLERAIPRCNFGSLTKSEQEIATICTSLCQTRCAVESESEGNIIEYCYNPSSLIKMGALLGGNPKNWIHKVHCLSKFSEFNEYSESADQCCTRQSH